MTCFKMLFRGYKLNLLSGITSKFDSNLISIALLKEYIHKDDFSKIDQDKSN